MGDAKQITKYLDMVEKDPDMNFPRIPQQEKMFKNMYQAFSGQGKGMDTSQTGAGKTWMIKHMIKMQEAGVIIPQNGQKQNIVLYSPMDMKGEIKEGVAENNFKNGLWEAGEHKEKLAELLQQLNKSGNLVVMDEFHKYLKVVPNPGLGKDSEAYKKNIQEQKDFDHTNECL